MEELFMKTHNVSMLILFVLTSGCGTMPEERAISGASIGAATGAVMGAVTSLAVGPGALIGALGGGLVGAMTNNSQINMGDPLWKRAQSASQPRQSAPAAQRTTPAPDPGMVASVQQRLAHLGYDPGPVDGIYGKRTADAVRRFQRDHGLEDDGLITAALAERVLGTPKTGVISI
jgi:hypothetical protein